MKGSADPYQEIIGLPHHQSAARPHMSLYNRAAQFSPYAALVGFDGVIAETARLTDRRKELTEDEKETIDRQLARIDEAIRAGDPPVICAEYFVPDPYKEGGEYRTLQGKVKRVNAEERLLQFFARNGISAGETLRIDLLSSLRWIDPVSPEITPPPET